MFGWLGSMVSVGVGRYFKPHSWFSRLGILIILPSTLFIFKFISILYIYIFVVVVVLFVYLYFFMLIVLFFIFNYFLINFYIPCCYIFILYIK